MWFFVNKVLKFSDNSTQKNVRLYITEKILQASTKKKQAHSVRRARSYKRMPRGTIPWWALTKRETQLYSRVIGRRAPISGCTATFRALMQSRAVGLPRGSVPPGDTFSSGSVLPLKCGNLVREREAERAAHLVHVILMLPLVR